MVNLTCSAIKKMKKNTPQKLGSVAVFWV